MKEFGVAFISFHFWFRYPPIRGEDFRERRLLRELPGILNWALEGLSAYLREGLNPPQAVLGSTQEYRTDMDVVGQWITERCEIEPRANVPTAQAFNDYSIWAREEVGWEMISKLKFRRHLTDRGFAPAKGTGGVRLITGLRLKSTRPASTLIGTLDDGRLVYDTEISDLPEDGGKS